MEKYELTFRFDDENHSLTRERGFPIDVLSEFLQSLFKVGEDLSKELILREVRGNCYAIDIVSPDLSVIHYLQDLHGRISDNRIDTLNKKENEYTRKISKILSDKRIYLNIHNKEDFNKVIKEIKFPKVFPYHYETDSIKGVIIRIGSRTESSQASIGISNYPGSINVTSDQEKELKAHYKKEIINFFITKKINNEDGKAEDVTLDDYRVVVGASNFYDTIERVRSRYGADLSKIENEHD